MSINVKNLEENYIVAKKVTDEAAKLKKEIMEETKEVFIGIDDLVAKAKAKSDLERDIKDGNAVSYKGFDVVRLGGYYAAFVVRKRKTLTEEQQKNLNSLEKEALKSFAGKKPYKNDYIKREPPSSLSDFKNFIKAVIPKEKLKELGISMTALLKLPLEEQKKIVKKASGEDYVGTFMAAAQSEEFAVVRISKEYSGVSLDDLVQSVDFKKVDVETLRAYEILKELKIIYEEDEVDNLFLVLKELKELGDLGLAEMWRYEILKNVSNPDQLSKITLLKSIKYDVQDTGLLEKHGILVPKVDRRRYTEENGIEERSVSLYGVSTNLFEIKATIDAVADNSAKQKRLKKAKIFAGV